MKVVLITGASSGIGRAAALLFSERGYTVYAGARRTQRMRDLAEKGIHTLPLDVTDSDSCERFISEALKNEGHIDVLVNSAGYGAYGPVEAVALDKALSQLEVNVFGAMRMAQLCLPHLRESGGRIIHIGSAGGRSVTPFGGWYHASKYALEALTDAMRMELKGSGVEVVLLEPGGVHSAWGGITADHLRVAGHGTVYERDCDEMAAVYRAVYREDNPILTSPERVAHRIVRAAQVRRPRARYLFGFGARTLVGLHAILPSRAYDRLMTRVFTSSAVRKFAEQKESRQA